MISVGVELLVSASRSFLPMAILGTGVVVPVLEGLGRGLSADAPVCSGFSSFRCCRETEICRAIDSSTGFMLALFSSRSSTSVSSWDVVVVLGFECVEDAGDEGDGFLSLLAMEVDAVEGVCCGVCCCGGVTICHLGDWIYEAGGRTASDLTTSNSGDERSSVGDSNIRLDESGLNWYSLAAAACCSLALARVAMVSLPLGWGRTAGSLWLRTACSLWL